MPSTVELRSRAATNGKYEPIQCHGLASKIALMAADALPVSVPDSYRPRAFVNSSYPIPECGTGFWDWIDIAARAQAAVLFGSGYSHREKARVVMGGRSIPFAFTSILQTNFCKIGQMGNTIVPGSHGQN
ncbi:hypothetical protein C8J57DRAFT_1477949, partial [Mycena rebaudengoi]